MATRTAVLARFASPDALGHDLATVPDGETWIIKNLQYTNFGGAHRDAAIWVRNADSTVGPYIVSIGLEAGNFNSQQVWVVIEPGDVLVASGGGAGVHMWISGAILPGVAA